MEGFLPICALLVTLSIQLGVATGHTKPLSEDPEVHMNTTQLITSKGYPCENYDVHTADGYKLQIQRIPAGRHMNRLGAPKPVVYLQHGLISCSACWVENLVNESLGFMLADAGFDVWLGNSRGNTYAKRHERLSPKDKEFWAFSWDEMAKYDLPATIDKILSVSQASQLSYVGHSQGGAIIFAALSMYPDLAKKINVMFPLAPAVYLDSMKSPLRYMAPYSTNLAFLFELLGDGEFMANSKIITWLGGKVCGKEIPQYLCANMLFIFCGYDFKQMNESRIPVYLGQHPAGTSVQNIIHFAQMVNTGKFQMFDFGAEENMKKYNQSSPPEYFPHTANVPVYMYSGTSDWLVSPPGINQLVSELPQVMNNDVIQSWEHLDFIWAMDAPPLCYDDIIDVLKKKNGI